MAGVSCSRFVVVALGCALSFSARGQVRPAAGVVLASATPVRASIVQGALVLPDGVVPGSIKSLDLHDCRQLTNVDALKDLKELQTLNLGGCIQLTNIDGLKNLTALRTLDLDGCTQLTNIDGLKDLKGLRELNLGDGVQLTNIDALKDLKGLRILYLGGCTQLSKEAVDQLGAALPRTEINY